MTSIWARRITATRAGGCSSSRSRSHSLEGRSSGRWSRRTVAPTCWSGSENTLRVGRETIDAVSAAAAFGAGIGGTAGVAVSGAGGFKPNIMLTKVNAYADASNIGSASSKIGELNINATSKSTINATVVAAALAIGGGGTAGVGVSIGIAVAQNYVGRTADGVEVPSAGAGVSQEHERAGGRRPDARCHG